MRITDRSDTEPANAGPSWRPFLPAVAMLAASVVLIAGLSIRTPAAGEQVALVFAPGVSPEAAIGGLAGVDARIVRPGGLDNVVVAYFERAVSWAELRRLGVLLPLDPILAGGCAIPAARVASSASTERDRT
jgi:hypothetical protein